MPDNPSDEFDLGAQSAPTPAPASTVTLPANAISANPPFAVNDDPDAPVTLPPENFPTDLGEAFRLLQRLDNDLDDEGNRRTSPGTRHEQRARALRLKRLKAHVHAIQQGDSSAPWRGADEESETRLANESRRANQAKRLAELAKKHPAVAATISAAKS